MTTTTAGTLRNCHQQPVYLRSTEVLFLVYLTRFLLCRWSKSLSFVSSAPQFWMLATASALQVPLFPQFNPLWANSAMVSLYVFQSWSFICCAIRMLWTSSVRIPLFPAVVAPHWTILPTASDFSCLIYRSPCLFVFHSFSSFVDYFAYGQCLQVPKPTLWKCSA